MFFFFFCSVLLFFSCFLCAPLQQLACYRLFYSATTPLSSSSPHPPRPSIFLSWITHFIPTQLSITWHQLSLQQENNHSNITRILFCFLILATKMTFLDGSPPPSLGCHTKASSRMTVLLLHNMNVLTEIRGEHIWFFILGGLSFFVLLGVPKANKIKSENERTNIFCVQQKTNKRRHKQTTHKNQQRATGSKQKEETIHVFGPKDDLFETSHFHFLMSLLTSRIGAFHGFTGRNMGCIHSRGCLWSLVWGGEKRVCKTQSQK